LLRIVWSFDNEKSISFVICGYFMVHYEKIVFAKTAVINYMFIPTTLQLGCNIEK
jgi:hypothetical protein